MLKIGITGHRVLLNEPEVKKNIQLSIRYFKEIDYNLVGFTALALGADTIFANEIIRVEGSLNIILPFSPEEYLSDFEDEQSKKEFESFLHRYRNNIEVNQLKNPSNQQERDEAYLLVGKRIVDESDVILAVWDGQMSNGIGGTAEIIAYAQTQGKQVHIIKGIRQENGIIDKVDQLFYDLDKQAIRYKKRFFQPIWLSGLITGVLTVICFATIVSFLHCKHPLTEIAENVKSVIAILEVVFLIFSFVLLTFFANKWKQIFLAKRRATEYLRSLIWFKNAEIPILPLTNTYNTDGSDDANNILAFEKRIASDRTEIGDKFNAKRMLWCLADEQATYHQKKRIDKFTRNVKNIHLGCTLIKIIFFVAVGFKFYIEMLGHKETPYWMIDPILSICIFTVIVLPSLYTMLEGIKYFGDWKRKINTSRLIIDRLTEIKKRILNMTDDSELSSEAKVLRDVLNFENIEWLTEYLRLNIESTV